MKKRAWKIFLICFLLFYMVVNHYYKNITSNIPYTFFPEQDLTDFYKEYEANKENPSSSDAEKTQDFSVIARTELYYQNVGYCRMPGNKDKDRLDFRISMDWYPPDEENETLNILKDYGDVIYDKDLHLPLCKFVCLTERYKKTDVMNHDLTITNDGDSDVCVLGVVDAVYLTPGKSSHHIRYVSDGGAVVIPTRNGWGFLKDFCIFHVYKTPDTYPAPNPSITYQIRREETILAECRFP